MTNDNSSPPDNPAVSGRETNSTDNEASQRQGATDNDVIIVQTIAGLIITFFIMFKDEIKNGISDMFRRVKRAGPVEFYSSTEINESLTNDEAPPDKSQQKHLK